MAQTIIESLRNYFLTCPLMGQEKINVDFLPEQGVEYSIDTTPAAEVVRQYVDGSSVRQYLFVIRSVNDYGADTLQNITNSGFFEALSDWLEKQTMRGILPLLPTGRSARKIEAQSTGYLFNTGPDAGKYQIQCRLEYFQEG